MNEWFIVHDIFTRKELHQSEEKFLFNLFLFLSKNTTLYTMEDVPVIILNN